MFADKDETTTQPEVPEPEVPEPEVVSGVHCSEELMTRKTESYYLTDKEFWEKHEKDAFKRSLIALESAGYTNIRTTFEMWRSGCDIWNKEVGAMERTFIRSQIDQS